MNVATICVSVRPPRVALALAGALLLASIAAIIIQEIGACGGCATRQGAWKFVAPAGLFGYAILIATGLLSPQRLFPIGTAVAAGVHTVLMAASAVLGKFCPVCVVAAALAIALFVVTLAGSRFRAKLLALAYVPAVLLASGPTAWALIQEEARENERQSFVRAIHETRATPDEGSVLTIQVFEQDHCGYCRDFREIYQPRLERDFGARVRVHFLQATATNWVRRTPTIVVQGGPVYEGLPETYAELRAAVGQALPSGK